jgi:hypothetical protein
MKVVGVFVRFFVRHHPGNIVRGKKEMNEEWW